MLSIVFKSLDLDFTAGANLFIGSLWGTILTQRVYQDRKKRRKLERIMKLPDGSDQVHNEETEYLPLGYNPYE